MGKGNPIVNVRVTPDLQQAMEKAATAAGLTVPEWHRRVLEEATKEVRSGG